MSSFDPQEHEEKMNMIIAEYEASMNSYGIILRRGDRILRMLKEHRDYVGSLASDVSSMGNKLQSEVDHAHKRLDGIDTWRREMDAGGKNE